MFYGRYADYTMFPHLDVLKILVVGDEDELVKVLLALDMAELSGDSPIVGDMEVLWWKSDAGTYGHCHVGFTS
jgi:hypothetical protein